MTRGPLHQRQELKYKEYGIGLEMKIILTNFWVNYRADLEKFLEMPRSVLLGFFVPIVIAMAWLITVWCFVLLLLPFVYSAYRAYKRCQPSDIGVALLVWSRT